MYPVVAHIKEFSTRVTYNGQTLSAIKPTLLTSCEQSNLHKGSSYGHLIKILKIHMNDPVINTLIDPHFTISGYYIGIFLNTNLPGNFLWISDKKQLEHVCGCVSFEMYKPNTQQSRLVGAKKSRFVKNQSNAMDIKDLETILDDPVVLKNGGRLFYVNSVLYKENNKIVIQLSDSQTSPSKATFYFEDEDIKMGDIDIKKGELFKITPSIVKVAIGECDPSNLTKTTSTTVINYLSNNGLLKNM